MFRTVSYLIGAAMLCACATMSEQECRVADWYAVGYEDGSVGRPISTMSKHRENCAEYGIAPPFEQYKQGHENGVVHYCTPENGLAVGRNGHRYHNVCPGPLAAAFVPQYQRGLKIHDLNRKIYRLEQNVQNEESAIVSDKQRIIEIVALLVQEPGTSETRAQLLSEMLALEEGLDTHEKNIDRMNADLVMFRQDLYLLERGP